MINTAYAGKEVNYMYNTTVNNAQNSLENIISMILRTGEAVNVVTDEGNVIMFSEFEYRSLLETLDIYAHPEYMQSLFDAENCPPEDWVDAKDIDWGF
ncbi:MAG: hypothetical protein LBC56_05560 [Oscillospiraceae bacterium]|jgi:PHD/YefM family antitoxin component YafN of YafNO toxin-antitoxin module|nr:hypothetical protein [Oscillospiraceae bacterium]